MRKKYEKHGLGNTDPLYKVYDSMRQRCLNPKRDSYRYYGGRGITICAEWLHSFAAFRNWALANGFEPGLLLDRKNNDEGYSPSNCRFTTSKVQMNNTRWNKNVTAFGETKSVSLWTEDERCKPNAGTFRTRLRAGWPVEEALTKPKNHRR